MPGLVKIDFPEKADATSGDGRGVPLQRSLGNVVIRRWLRLLPEDYGRRREGASELKPVMKGDVHVAHARLRAITRASRWILGVP